MTISRANLAAHRLFGDGGRRLAGRNIRRYHARAGHACPSMGETPQAFRTEMQCRGERANGDVFLANVFFSTYQHRRRDRAWPRWWWTRRRRLREREEASLEQLLAGSRILVGAVSHEVRNVCGAIGVIYENLVRSGALNGNKDFEALGSLVETLQQNRVAGTEAEHQPIAGGRRSTWPRLSTICASCWNPIAKRPRSPYTGTFRRICRPSGPTGTACCKCC